jgi:fatty-acyl-CoA synthase
LLFVDGRDDDMIISGGENVFPLEVENLLFSHPEVADVSVLGVDDADFGQRLAAFIVLKPDAKLDDEAVRSFVKDSLARFKVPRDVIFVPSLPRNQTGKVLKNELRAKLA